MCQSNISSILLKNEKMVRKLTDSIRNYFFFFQFTELFKVDESNFILSLAAD